MAAKSKKSDNLLEKFIPILLVASIGLAFMVGILWQKVSNLEGGGSKVAGAVEQEPSNPAQAPQGPPSGKLSEDQAAKLEEVNSKDHVRGNKNAEVFLIEYSDYECPFCSRFHPTAQQVVDEYQGKVAWVYRHFPLDQIHPKARPAAEASECVAELGGEDAFWSFTDKIFEDQTALSDLSVIVTSVGLDGNAIQKCIDDGTFKEKVDDQAKAGMAAGITGTPGNFIVNKNGDVWLVPGALPFEQLKTTIDEALGS